VPDFGQPFWGGITSSPACPPPPPPPPSRVWSEIVSMFPLHKLSGVPGHTNNKMWGLEALLLILVFFVICTSGLSSLAETEQPRLWPHSWDLGDNHGGRWCSWYFLVLDLSLLSHNWTLSSTRTCRAMAVRSILVLFTTDNISGLRSGKM